MGQKARALALLTLVAFSSPSSAQTVKGGAGIAGVVRDTMDNPLPLVTVIAEGRDLSDVTDSLGQFFISGLPFGPTDFLVMRLGYTHMGFTATLTTDSTLVIAIRMRRVTNLAPVSITAPRAIAALTQAGFYQRQHTGLGSFVTPHRVDSLADRLSFASQLLRDVSGVDVVCGKGGCTVRSRRAHECLLLFVDGVRIPGVTQIDDVVPLGEVGAIEVFPNPTTVPMEFQGRLPPKRGQLTAKAGCGAIAVWTRTRLDRSSP